MLVVGAGPFEREDPDVAEGNAALAEDRATDAISAYERAGERLSSDPRITYNLGLARAAAGQVHRALDDLGRAATTEATPKGRSRAQFARGNAYRRIGRLDEAIGAYRDALLEDPTYAPARRNLELTHAMKRIQAQQRKNDKGGNSRRNPEGPPDDDDPPDAGTPDGGGEPPDGGGDGGAGRPPPEPADAGPEVDAGGPPPEPEPNPEDDARPEEPDEVNAQDTEQILDALQQQERALRRKRLAEQFGQADVEKDW